MKTHVTPWGGEGFAMVLIVPSVWDVCVHEDAQYLIFQHKKLESTLSSCPLVPSDIFEFGLQIVYCAVTYETGSFEFAGQAAEKSYEGIISQALDGFTVHVGEGRVQGMVPQSAGSAGQSRL